MKKVYVEVFNERLKRYNFSSMLSEPTYGEDIIKSELSENAYKLISQVTRDIYFNREFLLDYFKLMDFPIYEKVIEFFCIYGGRIFYYENDNVIDDVVRVNKGYRIKSFPLRFEKLDGNYYYECMEYHYAGDWGPHINQDGKIYSFSMGQYTKMADSMAEFMENQFNNSVLIKARIGNISDENTSKEYLVNNKKIMRRDNIYENVYEHLVSYCIPEMFNMIQPLIMIILEEKISLNNEQIDQLMELILSNENMPDELIIDIVEFLSNRDISFKTIENIIDVVTKVNEQEWKQKFLIDKLFQWEDQYPSINDKIMGLL